LGPVLMLGYSRSGTTLLRVMLDAHPGICIAREHEHFLTLPRKLRREWFEPGDARELVETILAERRALLGAESREVLEQEMLRTLPGGLSAVLTAIHMAYLRVEGRSGARWGAKKPQHWRIVSLLRRLYPNAQYVYIVRDPLDVVASMLEHFPHHVPMGRVLPRHLLLAWHWRRSHRDVMRHGSIVGSGRFAMLRYEDLVKDGERELRRLCAFLEVPFEEGMLRPQDAVRTGRVTVRSLEKVHRELRSAPHRGRIGRFSRTLSPLQASDVAWVCREEMKALHYAPPRQGSSAVRRAMATGAVHSFELAWAAVRTVAG
jgi:hypothetical protein